MQEKLWNFETSFVKLEILFNIIGCQMWVAIGQLNDVEQVFQIVLEFFNSTVEFVVDLAVYH